MIEQHLVILIIWYANCIISDLGLIVHRRLDGYLYVYRHLFP